MVLQWIRNSFACLSEAASVSAQDENIVILAAARAAKQSDKWLIARFEVAGESAAIE
jgi:hypothetical protein